MHSHAPFSVCDTVNKENGDFVTYGILNDEIADFIGY